MMEVCPLAPAIGETLDGKYQIVREVRREATGVVYEAMATSLGRRVAVKTLFEATSGDSQLAARCQREARAAGGIGNPHIIAVFDSGRSQRGLLFLATELLDGVPLSAWLKQSLRLPVPLAVDVMSQVLGGLSAAHQHGIVHRGLTPESIFVGSGKERPNLIKLIDFGIPKVSGPQAPRPAAKLAASAAGVVLANPLYMSPEQIRGPAEAIDHRTDIYSAGVILYQMLCGGTPFAGDDVPRLLRDILAGDYPRPCAVRPEIPAALESAIVRALERDVRKRFATAAAMRELISRCAVETAPASVSASALPDSFALEPNTMVDAPAVGANAGPRANPFAAIPETGSAPALDRDGNDRLVARPPSPPRQTAEPAPLRLDMSLRARALARDKGAVLAARRRARRGFPWLALLAGVPVVAVALIFALRGHRREAASPAPPPPREEMQRFFLRISPENANVTVDHVPVSARELPLDSGPPRAHSLKVAAPGHLTRTFTFTASAGMELVVRLGHTLPAPSSSDPPPLPAELAVDYPEKPRPAEEIVRAFAQLGRYAACLAVTAEANAAARKAGNRGAALGEEFAPCQRLIEGAAPKEPRFLALRPAAEAYVAAAHGGEKPETLGRMTSRFRAELIAERTFWQMQELARIGQDEGKKAAWHLRRVALAAAAWVRARRSSSANGWGGEAQAAKLEAHVQALEDYVRGGNQGIGSIRGADDFMRAAQELLALARPKTGARIGDADVYDACRKLLTDFDALVLD